MPSEEPVECRDEQARAIAFLAHYSYWPDDRALLILQLLY